MSKTFQLNGNMNQIKNALISRIKECLQSKQPLVVGIDGASGAGKTSFAKLLCNELNGKHIEVDSYLHQHRGEYVSHLRLEILRKDVAASVEPVSLIEGVCLLDILERIQITLDVLIYVKRVDTAGIWVDQNLCDTSRSLAKILEWLSHTESCAGKPGIANLDRELATYHHKFQPVERADIIVELATQ
jgi:hypothetical protein